MLIQDMNNKQLRELMQMAETFCNESQAGVTFNTMNALFTLQQYITSMDAAVIIDYVNTEPSGFAIVQRVDDWHTEYFGYLAKFYVMPNFRKTRSALRLMDEVVEWFDMRNCVTSYCTATAEIGHDAAFIKLLSRFGYVQTPTGILIRKKQ